MKTLLAVTVFLGLFAATASADIILGQGTYFKAYLSDPVSVGDGSESLVSYTLYFENISGDDTYNPTTAVGFGTVGSNTGVLVAGELHNEQFPSGSPPYAQQASPYQDQSGCSTVDTHWLFDSTDSRLVIPDIPTEEVVDGAGSAENGDYPPNGITGYSSHLSGGLGLDFGSSTPPAIMPVARIVVPEGSYFTIYAQAAAPGPPAQAENFTATIPEPGTMSLLVLGGLGFMIRRRRRGASTM